MLYLETERLIITQFTPQMAYDVHVNSLDADNRRFVPDEVFETEETARAVLAELISAYGGETGPFVYPVLRRDGANLGYVQLILLPEGWEVGYHIAAHYTGNGYATEAVRAFLPAVMQRLGLQSVLGVCAAENYASRRVMEKCGFTLQYEGIGLYQGTERPICRCRYQLCQTEDRT